MARRHSWLGWWANAAMPGTRYNISVAFNVALIPLTSFRAASWAPSSRCSRMRRMPLFFNSKKASSTCDRRDSRISRHHVRLSPWRRGNRNNNLRRNLEKNYIGFIMVHGLIERHITSHTDTEFQLTWKQTNYKEINKVSADARRLPAGLRRVEAKQSCDSAVSTKVNQSDQWFVCKCVETAQPIRGQETVGIRHSMTKSWGLGCMIMKLLTKLNLISGLSAKAWKLVNQSDASNHGFRLVDQWFVCKCVETAQPIRGQETVGIQHSMTKRQGIMTKLPTKFELTQSDQYVVCLQSHGNYSTN